MAGTAGGIVTWRSEQLPSCSGSKDRCRKVMRRQSNYMILMRIYYRGTGDIFLDQDVGEGRDWYRGCSFCRLNLVHSISLSRL